MHYVYALQSIYFKKLYIGMTENLERRLYEHNGGKTISTKPYVPYQLIYVESYTNKIDAHIRELQMKQSGKIRKALKTGNYTASSSNG